MKNSRTYDDEEDIFNLTSKVSKDDSFQNHLAPGESTFRRFCEGNIHVFSLKLDFDTF